MSEEKNIIKLNIDGIDIEVEKGVSVLVAAKKINIDIPTLCFLKGINAPRRL
jgi:NADH-quinone oxidoreductase subunit G/NADP-reducing hydrogenase subunit HndD